MNCEHCGTPFAPLTIGGRAKRHCSDRCREIMRLRRKRKRASIAGKNGPGRTWITKRGEVHTT